MKMKVSDYNSCCPRNRYGYQCDKCKDVVPRALVPSYVENEEGHIVCVPVPELKRTFASDGVSCEISALMYGRMPEDLSQVNMFDAMDSAEHVTSECVRRFGSLEKQRQAILEKNKEYENTK